MEPEQIWKRLTEANLKFEIRKLVLNPGDRVVFRTEQILNTVQCEELRTALEKLLPEGVRSVIVTGGVSLTQG